MSIVGQNRPKSTGTRPPVCGIRPWRTRRRGPRPAVNQAGPTALCKPRCVGHCHREVLFVLNGSHTQSERRDILRRMHACDRAVLLATDAAGEGLNLQFCSAIVNYDLPWNPMRLEQRIGRVDRIGQAKPVVAVVNLFHRGTVEYDAYQAIQDRLGNILDYVGPYGAIVAAAASRYIRRDIQQAPENPSTRNFRQALGDHLQSLDFQAMPHMDMPERDRTEPETQNPYAMPFMNQPPLVDMQRLEQALHNPALLPPGWLVTHVGGSHWRVQTKPAAEAFTVTTDRNAYLHALSSDHHLSWWGPGHPLFESARRQGLMRQWLG